MKVFETFREFRVFVFTYWAITKNAELAENKIGVIFDWENPWKGIRVSWEIILRLFYLWRKAIINFRRFRQFHEFRGINTSDGHCSILHVPFHFVSFFPFENGMPVCHKKAANLFLKNLRKFWKFTISSISCFRNIKEVWYKDWKMSLYKPQKSPDMLLVNNREIIPDYSTEDFFSRW